ncbi:conserved hypothetical protein [Aspergillus terreus NIH2624]|uniref:Uncharacterized protein n=1 Tax=Aspergillus terreus (strain NIH 2624 / FGSC A1156) TaxID=341663 RepID=Q0CQH3_ASPTN|nr:uncharacterized protein ATEG_04061 [Aspergillus terreus NIH2624]EAU35863.1 conserved hypothetical protein [Aspergillus terreus NIH2624]
MAASWASPNSPLAGYYKSARSTATTYYQQACNRRLRARPTRTLFLTVAACFFFLVMILRSSSGTQVDYWAKYPSFHFFHDRPEHSQVLPPHGPTIGINDTLPTNLTKTNPAFHVAIPARKKSRALCRLITSAMILNYPPPTLVRYGRQLPEGSREYDAMVDRITGIYNFLAYTPHVRDDDFVLIADGQDFFFQLPPEVMIQRFQDLLRENNEKLLKKYGLVKLERAPRRAGDEKVQKYTQRVLFSASKECFPNLPNDAGCVAVPSSSLPPDVYGWKTDLQPHKHRIRPRWIKPGAAIGQAGDLKAIYAELLHFVDQHRNVRGDYLALTQMFGRQEYVRELERRRSSSWLKEFLYRQIGISDASNITGADDPHLEGGRRYEYGIGLDYESRIFFNMLNSKMDVEWLKYNNISKTSSVQMEHGVPREHRLLLPDDLTAEKIGNPFTQPKFAKDEWVSPAFNKTLDKLPNSKNTSWHNIPLLTNIHSASVPALVHLDGDPAVRDFWWKKMWYQPHARALLRKYMRSPTGFEAAQSAMLGGQEWWDLRGGKGGLWTDKGEWLDFAEVCTGFERDLFDDGFGRWAHEGGDDDEQPVYNQFGNLIKGKEK